MLYHHDITFFNHSHMYNNDYEGYINDVYRSIKTPESISLFIYNTVHHSDEIDIDYIIAKGDTTDLYEYIDNDFIVRTTFRYAKEHYDEHSDLISKIKIQLRKYFGSDIDYIESDIIDSDVESGFNNPYHPILPYMFCDERILGRWIYDKVYLKLYSRCKYQNGMIH